MTDTYGSFERQARVQAIGAIDDDPEQASRALKLEEASGVNASVIHADVEGFDRQFKSQLTSQIIQKNSHLQDYINSHPMAAKVSSDDWAQLDVVSEHLKPFGDLTMEGSLKNFAEGFSKGAGPEGIGKWLREQPGGAEFAQKYPYSAAAWYALGAPIEVPLRLFSGGIQGGAEAVSGWVAGLADVAGVGDQDLKEKVKESIITTADMYFTGRMSGNIHPTPGVGQVKNHNESLHRAVIQAYTKNLDEIEQAIAPYVDAGEPIPVGLHPAIDKIKVEQSKLDIKVLDNAFKEMQKTTTLERSPEMAKLFAEIKDKTQIGIKSDAIQELYGDKPPSPDDGILGWLPDIASRLEEAKATGGDIEISLADALTKISPEVYDELHDHIRIRPGGLTVEEGKELSESIKPIKISPTQFEGGTDLVTGAKIPETAIKTISSGGEDVGHADLRREGNKISIQAIQTYPGFRRQGHATALLKDLFKEFPDHEIGYDWLTSDGKQFFKKVSEIDQQENIITSIRTQAALDPTFGPPQQLKLRKAKFKDNLAENASHTFAITDEKGRSVGQLFLAEQKEGKDLYVEWIGAHPMFGEGMWAFSHSLIRQLGRQLKEEFPNAEWLVGDRVSGIRGESGKPGMVRIPLKALRDEPFGLDSVEGSDHLKELQDFFGGQWNKINDTISSLEPTDVWKKNEQTIIDNVNKVLNRVIPKGVEHAPSRAVALRGRQVHGLYAQFEDALPLLLWSLKGRNERLGKVDPLHTAKHEAMHHLIEEGFYTPKEVEILEDAAVNNGWIEKHGIESRYGGEKLQLKIREAISEEFGEWERNPKSDHPVAKLFQKLKDLLDQIRLAVKEVLGFEPTWKDLFSAAERGEIGSRPEITGERKGVLAQEKQPELPGLTRQEDLEPFKPNTLGIDAKHYAKLTKLMDQVNAEAEMYQMEKAVKLETKKQTKEWKEKEGEVRTEVKTGVENRLDINLARYFAEGLMHGEKLDKRPKLNEELLTKEQKDGLPPSITASGGINPDDVAGIFGYQSGRAMVDALIEHYKNKGELSLNKYVDKIVDKEVENRMHQEIDENILQEARDQVLTPTQIDLLHEETVAAGMRAGSEMPFKRQDLKDWVKQSFAKKPQDEVSSRKYFDLLGRIGKQIQVAHLDGKLQDAFKLMQQREMTAELAKEALKFEKEKAKFDKQMKKLSKRELSGVEQEFTNFIHGLMLKAEIPVNRTPQDVAYEIGKGADKNLESFTATQVRAGYELNVPDSILEGDIKPLEQMSVEEFRQFRDVTTSLEHIGRKVNSVEIAGRRQAFADWRKGVLENTQTLPEGVKRKHERLIAGIDAELTRMEEIARDLDLRKELGPLHRALIGPMMEGKHTELDLQGRLVKDLDAIRKGGGKEWRDTLGEKIPQDFLIDPKGGLPFDITRQHMINIMLNWGNPSSIEKFTNGWFGKDGAKAGEAQLQALFDKHAKPEDWEFVKNIAKLFQGWKELADNMYRNLSGIAPKWLDIPDGGWYYPVIYDRWYSDINSITEKADTNALFGGNYIRATTSNGYTNTRTGYVGRVEFINPMPELATRMKQYIHDISYRPAVIQAAKIIYDPQIKEAISHHYGPEYERQLDPWLKAIAQQYNRSETEIAMMNAIVARVRTGVVVHYLGFNMKQYLTPDVGVLTVPQVYRALHFTGEAHRFAMENSRELQHTMVAMDRDFREALDRAIDQNKLDRFEAAAAKFAFYPMTFLSQQFRQATWTKKYQDAIAQGKSHRDAADIGDMYIRERHSATGVPDLPAIMRGGETRKFVTMFYGFGSSVYNWSRQIPGAVRQGDWTKAMASLYGAVVIPGLLTAGVYTSRKESDSIYKTLARGFLNSVTQTVPLVREAGQFITEHQGGRTVMSSAVQAAYDLLISDAYNYAVGNQNKIHKPILHAARVVGIGAKLPLEQIGKTSQFLRDVSTGQQRPRGFAEYLRGVIYGESKLKK